MEIFELYNLSYSSDWFPAVSFQDVSGSVWQDETDKHDHIKSCNKVEPELGIITWERIAKVGEIEWPEYARFGSDKTSSASISREPVMSIDTKQNEGVPGTHKCPYCPCSYSFSGGLQRHVANKHFPNNKQSYICDVCYKTFQRSDVFKRHYREVHLKQGRRYHRQELKILSPHSVDTWDSELSNDM